MQSKRIYFLLILCSLLFSSCQSATSVNPPTPTITLVLPKPTVTITTAPGASPTLSATLTPTLKSAEGWLAFIDNGHLTVQDLQSGQAAQIEGEYQQIVGWSPGGKYLLAVRNDGASIVVDATGRILSELDDLPQPAFWAAMKDKSSSDDWLAIPKKDGALGLLSFPSLMTKVVFEPGSLGADGLASVRWGSNGEVILTPSLNQLQNKVSFEQGYFSWMLQNGPNVQNLSVGLNGGSASQDFHQTYFQVLDSVPGNSSSYELLGFLIENQCSSCQMDGLELVSLDAWSGKILPLGATLLDTLEAYAWNPAQPGLMALAEGGSRFTLGNKRLALLDVPAGTLRYLTGKEQVVFEPSWSPDGLRLAFTTLAAREQASGSGLELEALLGGRVIAVYDMHTGATQTLTHPAKNEIDGWPRWSADGKMLLYARKRLADATTQVRQLDLASGDDRLGISLSGVPLACHRIGCGWDQMLAYTPGKSATTNTSLGQVLAPTATASVLTNTPRQGMTTYHNPAYGISFQYPASWELTEIPNFIQLTSQKARIIVGYRRATQQAQIQRTGVGAGDFVSAGSIRFLGQTLQRNLLVYEGKVKEVFYHSDSEFSVGDLVFTLGLDNYGSSHYEDSDIPKDVQEEGDQILESFVLDP